jgi:transcriptional regulator with GAF, ATPase, and Fis domain
MKSFKEHMSDAAKQWVIQVLTNNGFNIKRSAESIPMDRRNFKRLMKRYNVSVNDLKTKGNVNGGC